MINTILLNADAAQQAGGMMSMLPFLLILGVMFFFMYRSNKKQEKEARELRDSLEVGDEIVTIGGIVARVVKIEEDTLLIESGADRSKIRMRKDAISSNNTAIERIQKERTAQREAAAAQKEEKKQAKADKKKDK